MTLLEDDVVDRLKALAASSASRPGSAGSAPGRSGERVGDRFELDEPIGEGGMGVVYRALDHRTRGLVAVKIVRVEGASERERFAREAAALASLRHPGIVRYIAHGTLGDDERWLATELLEGVSLAERLAAGRLDPRDAALVGRRAAGALAAAHRVGIVHRDVKPSNLFLVGGDTGRVVLLDFGLARGPDAVSVTRPGTVLGTVCYIAPEQLRSSADVDARADVFALGLVLFECLTGRAAFEANDTEAALMKVLLEEAPRVRQMRPEIPSALDALVGRMLEKRPEDRPADADAVATALAAVEALEPTAVAGAAVGVGPRIASGDVVAGKYEVEGVLGQGGMGVVVAARHLQLERPVAIKVLRAAGPDDEGRFLREAQAASRLESEHATRVLDFGTLPDGAPYMVMELLTGMDLGQLLRQSGALPPETAVDYVLQAAEAVAEAHARGIVHRDLKPSNLFLTERLDGSPLVKVLDFGISKLTRVGGELDGSSPSLTASAAVMGSPRYMSPEQLKSTRDVDHTTDIWSLGAVLYELCAGRPAFDAATAVAVAARIASEPPAPLGPEIPAELAAAIRRCLEKDGSARYRDVAELAAALAPLGTDSSRALALGIARISGQKRRSGRPSAGEALAAPVTSAAPGSRGPLVWGLGLGAALLVGLTALAMRRGEEPPAIAIAAPSGEASAQPIAPTTAPPAPAPSAALAVSARAADPARSAASVAASKAPSVRAASAAKPHDQAAPGGASASASAARPKPKTVDPLDPALEGR